jgi:hypothetical protein
MASTRGGRLRAARSMRFSTANAAAKALGMAASTYGAHERAELEGGRDFGPDEAKKYAQFFDTTAEWLLTGYQELQGRRPRSVHRAKRKGLPGVPVIGYVGAGSEAHYYAVSEESLDEVHLSELLSGSKTVAVEIRGESLGTLLNRWLVFYDDVRRPVTLDLHGKLCVVGLEDGRILVKQVEQGQVAGSFDLVSANELPTRNVVLVWAARVKNIMPR